VAIPRLEIEALAARVRSVGSNFRAISVGRFVHWKGFHLGLMAFARLQRMYPDAEYFMLGEGPETANLRKLAERLNLGSNVFFLGSLPRERTLAELAAATCSCIPACTIPEDGLAWRQWHVEFQSLP